MIFHLGMFKAIVRRRFPCDRCGARLEPGEVIQIWEVGAYARLCRACVAWRLRSGEYEDDTLAVVSVKTLFCGD